MAAGELRARLVAIEAAAERAIGVNEYEELLEDLVDYLRSGEDERTEAADALIGLTSHDRFPCGAIETLEFTMHQLRWSEVRAALLAVERSSSDLHKRHTAHQILMAFDEDWPDGEIYRAYR